ncbi:hypothetical protein [Helicobacter sp. T3_23-1059]
MQGDLVDFWDCRCKTLPCTLLARKFCRFCVALATTMANLWQIFDESCDNLGANLTFQANQAKLKIFAYNCKVIFNQLFYEIFAPHSRYVKCAMNAMCEVKSKGHQNAKCHKCFKPIKYDILSKCRA